MRVLLSMAFVVAATVLVCHGVFTAEDARGGLDQAEATSDAGRRAVRLRAVVNRWPYSLAASQALEERLALHRQQGRTPTGAAPAARAWAEVEDGFRDTAPWLAPPAAGAVGLLGLLLAVLLPATRVRGLVILLVLAGAVAITPSLMEPGSQVEIVDAFGPARHTITHAPHIAIALLALAALCLGCRAPRD